jgi:signal transduction histidine kinase
VASLLLRFGRLLTEAATPDELTALLARGAVELLGADGAAVFELTPSGMRLVAGQALPGDCDGLQTDAEVVGPELGELLLSAAGGRFAAAHALPLVERGDLFGALVLLSTGAEVLPPDARELALGMADFAAVALRRAADDQTLRQSLAELRATREATARTEKLRALGQMVAGVSHDLKNLLHPLFLQVALLRRKAGKLAGGDAALAPTLGGMEGALRRSVETVERLRNFSRQSGAREERADLDAALREAVALCEPKLVGAGRAAIALRAELGGPPAVWADPAELVAVLVNLLVNAIDAMPSGGAIVLRSGAARDGGWAEVRDTGPGMPPEVAARIFEPFFTTKGAAGTGLGLAMAHDFARRHGGELALDTTPGKGAAFRLWLPAAVQEQAALY